VRTIRDNADRIKESAKSVKCSFVAIKDETVNSVNPNKCTVLNLNVFFDLSDFFRNLT